MNRLLQRLDSSLTPIGYLIKNATTSQVSLAQLFEISDNINLADTNASDAIKAIKKLLLIYVGKDWKIIINLLNLLEVCEANCSVASFQVYLFKKDLFQLLYKLIGHETEAPKHVQEKILYLFQKWALESHNQIAISIYTKLRSDYVDFPIASEQSVFSETPETSIYLNDKQRKQLTKDLNVVANNLRIMERYLNDDNKPSEHLNDLDNLARVTMEMQTRIELLINQVMNEDLTTHLKELHKHITQLLIRYESASKSKLRCI